MCGAYRQCGISHLADGLKSLCSAPAEALVAQGRTMICRSRFRCHIFTPGSCRREFRFYIVCLKRGWDPEQLLLPSIPAVALEQLEWVVLPVAHLSDYCILPPFHLWQATNTDHEGGSVLPHPESIGIRRGMHGHQLPGRLRYTAKYSSAALRRSARPSM